MPRPKPDPIDIVIASKLSTLRYWRNMTQRELGEKIGVSFQQVQKYESARNRVAVSTLCHIARALDVSVRVFFEETEEGFKIENYIQGPTSTNEK